jgi:hypothetical protein
VARRRLRRTLLALAPVAVGATAACSSGSSDEAARTGASSESRLEAGAAGPTARTAAPTSWRGFGVGRWPGPKWRPYAPSSPFNRPIARGTPTHPRSAEMIATVLSRGGPSPMQVGVAQTRDDWGHPTYYAKSTDPVFRLQPTAPWGRNPIAGHRIPIPDAARPAGGGDGHMTVVTPDGWEYDFWQVQDKPAGGGTLRFSWGGRLRIDGDGLRGGGTASRFGNIAGMIRAQELAASRIRHALFVVIRCAGVGDWFGHGVQMRGQSSFVYPAVSGGARCPEGTMAPPLGARLQLTMSRAQIAALPVPAWKKAILRALARYGGYVGDTGGDGINFMFESSTMYTSFGFADPLVSFAQANGVRQSGGRYVFDIAPGVDWARYLRVVPPPRR